jgi:hypothetical protein
MTPSNEGFDWFSLSLHCTLANRVIVHKIYVRGNEDVNFNDESIKMGKGGKSMFSPDSNFSNVHWGKGSSAWLLLNDGSCCVLISHLDINFCTLTVIWWRHGPFQVSKSLCLRLIHCKGACSGENGWNNSKRRDDDKQVLTTMTSVMVHWLQWHRKLTTANNSRQPRKAT